MTAPRSRRFSLVDVFTAEALRGNPLAVVHDASEVDDATRAALARFTNLSETTFLEAPRDPAADYRVRIFSPGGELPFAGHPTLGSCHAWLAAGGVPRRSGEIVQECGIGLVRVRRAGGRLAFAAPPLLRSGPADADVRAHALRALGVEERHVTGVEWVDNGPAWLAVLLDSAATVLALRPDFAAMGSLKVGVAGPLPPDGECAFEVRAFAPGSGIPEDPVTGSFNAGLARMLLGAGLAPDRYVASQGAALGRAGRVHVERDGDAIWIGGDVTDVVTGAITL